MTIEEKVAELERRIEALEGGVQIPKGQAFTQGQSGTMASNYRSPAEIKAADMLADMGEIEAAVRRAPFEIQVEGAKPV